MGTNFERHFNNAALNLDSLFIFSLTIWLDLICFTNNDFKYCSRINWIFFFHVLIQKFKVFLSFVLNVFDIIFFALNKSLSLNCIIFTLFFQILNALALGSSSFLFIKRRNLVFIFFIRLGSVFIAPRYHLYKALCNKCRLRFSLTRARPPAPFSLDIISILYL